MNRLFEAMYLSEIWHGYWRSKGSVYAKARAMVLFDRVMANEDHRLQPHGTTFTDAPKEVSP